MSPVEPIVLVAHGSRDPRAVTATRALARQVGRLGGGAVVRAGYLDHTDPRPEAVLAALQRRGHRRAALVPLLLTDAFHGRVDLPAVVAQARAAGLRIPVRLTPVLGCAGSTVDGLLLAALERRLAEAAPAGFDALVLAAAGTRNVAARESVARVTQLLGRRHGVPALTAYASAAPPTAGEAVLRLRAAGARRVAVAAYFLAPGRLYESVAVTAAAAGSIAVAQPLSDAPELARLVLDRVAAGRPGVVTSGVTVTSGTTVAPGVTGGRRSLAVTLG